MSQRTTCFVVIVVALLCGCTTSDPVSSSEDQNAKKPNYPTTDAGVRDSLIDWLSGRFNTSSDLNIWMATRTEAECVSNKLSELVGSERLLDLGYDPNNAKLALPFADGERAQVANVLVGCINVPNALLSLFTSYDKLAMKPAKCLTAGIERSGLSRNFVDGLLKGSAPDPFSSDAQLGLGMSRLMGECLDPLVDLNPLLPNRSFPNEIDRTTTTVKPKTTTTLRGGALLPSETSTTEAGGSSAKTGDVTTTVLEPLMPVPLPSSGP